MNAEQPAKPDGVAVSAASGSRLSAPWLAALIVFVLAAAVTARLVSHLDQGRRDVLHEYITTQAGDHAQQIRQTIERNLSVTYALAARVRYGRGSVPDFDAVASQLLKVQQVMRNRVWAAAHVQLTEVTLDTDTTVHTVFGHQMGARKGYNPKHTFAVLGYEQ